MIDLIGLSPQVYRSISLLFRCVARTHFALFFIMLLTSLFHLFPSFYEICKCGGKQTHMLRHAHPKMHFGEIFQPGVPGNWQDYVCTGLWLIESFYNQANFSLILATPQKGS